MPIQIYIGVLLLLFSIGLKVKVKSLLQPEIWSAASAHLLVTVALLGTFIYLLSYTGLSIFVGMDWRASLQLNSFPTPPEGDTLNRAG